MQETNSFYRRLFCDMTVKDRHNQYRILGWMIAWIGTWLGTNLAIKYDILATGLPATLVTIIPTGLGIATMLAYRRYLRETDELRRKIELDALALSLGVGFVGSLSYWLLGKAGAVAEVDLLFMFVVMSVTYSVAVVAGQLRYK